MKPRRPPSALLTATLLAWVTTARAAGPTPPEPIDRPPPEYPATADPRTAPVVVVLKVLVDDHGHVEDTTVVESGGRTFDEPARAAVRRWTFRPAERDGKSIAAWIRVRIEFAPPQPTQTDASVDVVAAPRPTRALAAPPGTTGDVDATAQAIVVFGHAQSPSRGAGDYDLRIGALGRVPRRDAASLLGLAPGVFLANEGGGQGHPYQIFLRGFDAREGQDIEFTVDGVPVNDVGNVHGNGLADTHFIIPELVESLRVIAGPFDPHQGNFAVAGSASYDMGLARRGLQARVTRGSFGTERLLLLWGPEGHGSHTFGGVELFQSTGAGVRRASRRASAMAGYETRLGKTGTFQVVAGSYAGRYDQPGFLRADDVAAGRIGFYDTYDPSQGGDSSRHSVSVRLSDRVGDTTLRQETYFVRRGMRLRENYTGFVEALSDPARPARVARGDAVDQHTEASTFGLRASARTRRTLGGLPQSVEFGLDGRLDRVHGTQDRDRFGTTVPYRRELDLDSTLTNVGLYADASLRPLWWLGLRGGVRADQHHDDVLDRCASDPSGAPSVVDHDHAHDCGAGLGQRTTLSASILQPRATVLFGPFDGFTISVSRGAGARSIDPEFIAAGAKKPFATLTATEGGVAWAGTIADVGVVARSVFFQTRVEHDVAFSATEGRQTLADGTTRTGWSGSARATGRHADLGASVTLVRATFDDTHEVIPYTPPLVTRTDASVHGPLPVGRPLGRELRGAASAGFSYVGARPLPYGEATDPLPLLDASADLGWEAFELSLSMTNVLDRRYRMSEQTYVSEFRRTASPTLVPARHFTAGEPRALFVTLGIRVGGDGAP